MLTMSQKWIDKRLNPDCDDIIIKLTDGVTTFYFGSSDITGLSEGRVYGILTGGGSVRHNIDKIKRTWSRTSVSCTFSNLPYRKRQLTPLELNSPHLAKVRPSDDLTNAIIGRDCSVYLVNNYSATSLADCLNIFNGKVDRITSYDEKSISITLIDKSDILDKKCLVDTVEGVYDATHGSNSDLYKENRKVKLGWLYGIWDRQYRGLAKGFRLSSSRSNVSSTAPSEKNWASVVEKYMYFYHIAHHAIKKLTKVYISVEKDLPPKNAPFFNVKLNDTSYALTSSVVVQPINTENIPTSFQLQEYFEINSNRTSPVNTGNASGQLFFSGINSQFAHDENVTAVTKKSAGVRSCFRPSPGNRQEGAIAWEFNEGEQFLQTLFGTTINRAKIVPKVHVVYQGAIPNYSLTGIGESSYTRDARRKLFHLGYYLMITKTAAFNSSLGYYYDQWLSFAPQDRKYGKPDQFDLHNPTITDPTNANHKDQIKVSGLLNYTVNTVIPKTFHPKLVLFAQYNASTPALTLFPITDTLNTGYPVSAFINIENLKVLCSWDYPDEHDSVWLECEGRKYGASWVTDVNTPSRRFTTSDVIQEGTHIIASFICDELGQPTSLLDLPMWRACFNPYIPMRLQILDDRTIKTAIEELTNQMMCTFDWSAAGKAKLIPLRFMNGQSIFAGAYYDTATVSWNDIKKDSLKAIPASVDNIVNHLTVKSNWHEETQSFNQEMIASTDKIFQNTTSQGKYGERKLEVEWKNICYEQQTPGLVNLGRGVAVLSGKNNPVKVLSTLLVDTGRDGSVGLYSDIQDEFTLTLNGTKFSHLETGDRIKLDVSVDPHLLFRGVSWTAPHFMINEINFVPGLQEKKSEMTFKITRVYDTTPLSARL